MLNCIGRISGFYPIGQVRFKQLLHRFSELCLYLSLFHCRWLGQLRHHTCVYIFQNNHSFRSCYGLVPDGPLSCTYLKEHPFATSITLPGSRNYNNIRFSFEVSFRNCIFFYNNLTICRLREVEFVPLYVEMKCTNFHIF